MRKFAAILAVFNSKGEILLGRRNDNGKYTCPGGHREEGEEPEETAIRELKEETGLVTDNLGHLGDGIVKGVDGNDHHVHVFKTVTDDKPDSSGDPDKEVKEWEWIPTKNGLPKEVYENLHVPPIKNLLFPLCDIDLVPEEFDEENWDDEDGREVDLTKSIADIAKGRRIAADSNGPWYSYNHVLPESLRNEGYGVHLQVRPKQDVYQAIPKGARLVRTYADMIPTGVRITHKGKEVGFVGGKMYPDHKKAEISSASVSKEHRGKGLGAAAYEAFMAHAKHLGAESIFGGPHSTAASAVHQSLARKHGANYKSKVQNSGPASDYDDHYGSYEYALKSEEMAKTYLTPDSTANGMRPHEPSKYTNYNRVETYNLGQMPGANPYKLGNMYQHVYYDQPIRPGGHYQSVMHVLSTDPHPLGNTWASSASGIHSVNDPDPWMRADNLPWTEGHYLKQGETASSPPGAGFGTLLYHNMAKIHGRMTSDNSTSNGANALWEKLVQHPEFRGKTDYTKTGTHWLEYNGDRMQPSSVIHGDGRSLGDIIANPNPGYKLTENWAPDKSHVEVNVHTPEGQHAGGVRVHLDHANRTMSRPPRQHPFNGYYYSDFNHPGAASMALHQIQKKTGYQDLGERWPETKKSELTDEICQFEADVVEWCVLQESLKKGLKHHLMGLAAATMLSTSLAPSHEAVVQHPEVVQSPQPDVDPAQSLPQQQSNRHMDAVIKNPTTLQPKSAGMTGDAAQSVSVPPAKGPAKKYSMAWHFQGLPKEMMAISRNESMGGKYWDHAKNQAGPFWTAYGPLGMKPATAYDEFKQPYMAAVRRAFPGLENPHNFLNEFRLNPNLYNAVATGHWNRLKSMAGGDDELASFGWNQGVGALQTAITNGDDVSDHEYVQNYRNHKGKLFGTLAVK